MGVVTGLAKSDQGVRVAKAPRALLGVNDLADSVRARRKEAIVSCPESTFPINLNLNLNLHVRVSEELAVKSRRDEII
jgi:hypothetical protein